MLIYNHKKEFLGIDESYLRALGLSNMAELQNEADDFSDLFVKTPGYIHNFKHVHWIDYIICSDSGVDPKVVINVKGKNYTTSIDIKTIYLVDNPSEKAYRINLPNIRALSDAQSEQISIDIAKKPLSKAQPLPEELYHAPVAPESSEPKISFDPYEPDHEEIEPTPKIDLEKTLSLDVDIEEDEQDFTPELSFEEIEFQQNKEVATKEPEKELIESEDENPFVNYIYDPKTASEELGLPVDLVEEFIQDFIAQAKSFKNDLYESAENAELDNLKIQSHKLKGVAANLRIEDALDALSKVNTLEDYDLIKKNLDRLYKIIDKLSKADSTTIEQETIEEKSKELDDDDFVLSIKEDIPSKHVVIDDSQVPNSIEIPELADDEFMAQDIVIEDETIDEDLLISEEMESALDVESTYDKSIIAREMGLDIESFNELFEDYINEAKGLCDSMIESNNKENLTACKSAAVKLRGMSENMRIHDFDDELKAIINSSDNTTLSTLIENIVSKLNLISNQRG